LIAFEGEGGRLDAEGLRALEAESDLPGGWGPEDVRRFDDHKLTRAYPPQGVASIKTADGFKEVRPMPTGMLLWGQPSEAARAAYQAFVDNVAASKAAAAAEFLERRPDLGLSRRVVDDNPAPDGYLFKIKSLALRRAATVGVTACASVALLALVVVGGFISAAAALVRTAGDFAENWMWAFGRQGDLICHSARVVAECFKAGWKR
jgi:hypothetical protein